MRVRVCECVRVCGREKETKREVFLTIKKLLKVEIGVFVWIKSKESPFRV